MKNIYLFIFSLLFLGISATSTFDHIYKFGTYKKGWALVENNSKYGFIGVDGHIVVPLKYHFIYKFDKLKKGWAMVELNGNVGFIDSDGSEIVPPEYDYISKYNKKAGFFTAYKGGKILLLDKDGDQVISN
jgi:hypothetical protein